jgi:hypothetical protein
MKWIIGLIIIFLVAFTACSSEDPYEAGQRAALDQMKSEGSALSLIEGCDAPEQLVGIRCCIPDLTGAMCQDESDDMDAKIAKFDSYDDLSYDTWIDDKYPFKLKLPDGYVYIQDVAMGGIEIDYLLLSNGGNGEDYSNGEPDWAEIKVMHRENGPGISKGFVVEGLKIGILPEIRAMGLDITHGSYITNDNGVEGYLIESEGYNTLYGRNLIMNTMIFANDEYSVSISFSVSGILEILTYEFEEMYNSFEYK